MLKALKSNKIQINYLNIILLSSISLIQNMCVQE